MRPLLLLLGLTACATPPPPGLRVEPLTLDAPERVVTWREDAEDALAEAREKGRAALIYFVVPGDAVCRRMDRETISQPRVRGLGTRLAAIRANIDLTARRDLVGTYAPVGSVPGFTLFGVDGTLLARWTGFESADAFRGRVDRTLRESTVPARWSEQWAAAMAALAEDDVVPLRELVAKLEREDARALAARLSLAECREQFYRYRWAAVVASTDLFVKRFAGHPARREMLDIRGRALYRGSGQRDPTQIERAVQLIDRLDEPQAEDALVSIGEPIAEMLLEAVLERQGSIAEPAARALGRIRYSRLMPELIDALADRKLRFAVRARIIVAMNAWADAGFLAPLIAVLGNTHEPAMVRVAAAAAVARLGSSHGGLYGALVVAPIMSALDNRNVDLRRETLRALNEVSEPFELDRLRSAMKDTRAAGDGDARISDLACALFLRRAGAQLVGETGAPVDEFGRGEAAALLHWWNANQHLLRWEASRRRYVLAQ